MRNVFFLLSQPRCGSQLLTDFLNSHPDITAIHEPFNDKVNAVATRAYIHGAWDACPAKVLVIGVRYDQFRASKDLQNLSEFFPVIHLTRVDENALVASQNRERSRLPISVEMTSNAFGVEVMRCEDEQQNIRDRIKGTRHELTYEDMTAGSDVREFKNKRVRNWLLAFTLGVKDRDLTSDRVKGAA